ncbi:hypothetical protein [Microbacterium sp. KSW4-4]|uniref:hypothetical protein n=1 Tax=Microbacterium sp. KSW4-4 TaxID=2851651 RepID=UPI001FFD2CD1|nr:hypothetical protein [Microbacterium sp. KSW4-4]MCK2032627.1 hypothetical protein [Microbacterium sp. KSW4-4]
MATDVLGFGEYSDVLTDSNLAQFLAIQQWSLRADRTFDQIWLPNDVTEGVPPILLPRDQRLSDYSRRLGEAVHSIASVFGWRVSDLAEQVATIHADLFFVRVDQHSSDGTIPFSQATSLLENIEQLIRSAALTAWNPASAGRGRVPNTVKEFLSDDVRMGHTKKGSFIITVAARLDTEMPSTGIGTAVAPSAEDVAPSFTRRVMTQLARGVDATQRFARREDDFVDFDEALGRGMRLPLVQALHDMGDDEGVRSIDLSFEWAATEPQRESVPERITIERGTIEELPSVERRLSQRHEPEQVTLVGPVTELKRGNAPQTGEQSEGEVVVRADVNGRLGRITVPLAGEDYDWAIRAHAQRLPFTVSGELIRKGNGWRLGEPIEVDRDFLKFHGRQVEQDILPSTD